MEPPNFREAMALSTFVLFVLLLVAIVYQRLIHRYDYATVLGRGASFRPLRIGRSRWLISGACSCWSRSRWSFRCSCWSSDRA